jgi:hypothetical protein
MRLEICLMASGVFKSVKIDIFSVFEGPQADRVQSSTTLWLHLYIRPIFQVILCNKHYVCIRLGCLHIVVVVKFKGVRQCLIMPIRPHYISNIIFAHSLGGLHAVVLQSLAAWGWRIIKSIQRGHIIYKHNICAQPWEVCMQSVAEFMDLKVTYNKRLYILSNIM